VLINGNKKAVKSAVQCKDQQQQPAISFWYFLLLSYWFFFPVQLSKAWQSKIKVE